MRPDELYLRDLLAATEAIARFLADVEEEAFLADEVLQSAVLQKLAVIGEAATRVSQELRDEHDDVEWRTIIGLRNIVVHEYFAISWETIWVTAQRDLPDLARRAGRILESLGN